MKRTELNRNLWLLRRFNPFPSKWVLRALIDFTLSNARRFYSSMGNLLDRKGLRHSTMSSRKFRPKVIRLHLTLTPWGDHLPRHACNHVSWAGIRQTWTAVSTLLDFYSLAWPILSEKGLCKPFIKRQLHITLPFSNGMPMGRWIQ